MKYLKSGLVVLLLMLFMGLNYAVAGNSVGNADDDATLAYDQEVISKVENALSSKHLYLTKKQVKKRRKKLGKIMKNTYKHSVKQVVKKIEDEFGIDFFIDGESSELDSVDGILNAYTMYYNKSYKRPKSLLTADSRVVPDRGIIYTGSANVTVVKIKGSEKGKRRSSYESSLLVLKKRDFTKSPNFSVIPGYYFQPFSYKVAQIESSLEAKLFEEPRIVELIDGLMRSKIKALDAKIFLAAGEVSKKVKVKCGADSIRCGYFETERIEEERFPYLIVYPKFSVIAPVPAPIIYLSRYATISDITEMIRKEAPRIFAYNKLVDRNLIPRLEEINSILDDNSELVMNAFLEINYAIMDGGLEGVSEPMELTEMVDSEEIGPVFQNLILKNKE